MGLPFGCRDGTGHQKGEGTRETGGENEGTGRERREISVINDKKLCVVQTRTDSGNMTDEGHGLYEKGSKGAPVKRVGEV